MKYNIKIKLKEQSRYRHHGVITLFWTVFNKHNFHTYKVLIECKDERNKCVHQLFTIVIVINWCIFNGVNNKINERMINLICWQKRVKGTFCNFGFLVTLSYVRDDDWWLRKVWLSEQLPVVYIIVLKGLVLVKETDFTSSVIIQLKVSNVPLVDKKTPGWPNLIGHVPWVSWAIYTCIFRERWLVKIELTYSIARLTHHKW